MTNCTGPEYVYFIKALDAIKVGWSRRPHIRCAELQCKVPVRLELFCKILGGRKEEKLFHKAFKRYRRWGEWYSAEKAVMDTIYHCLITNKIPYRELEMLADGDEYHARLSLSEQLPPDEPGVFYVGRLR
ncbi:MAG: GIY-YIG nuclease family protein [Pseudomonadota bacterium]